jgi:hypothetical protein
MKGLKAEDRVAASLRRSGAKVEQSIGSRTSADNVARWPNGKKWFTQVKYSGKGNPASPTPNERRALIRRAENNNATPVIAKVTPEKIEYFSAKDGRKLNP